MSAFVAEEYSLDLCLDEQLAEGGFTLLFDEHPCFDGEPEIAEPEQAETVKYRQTA